jgi:hypothetical protein
MTYEMPIEGVHQIPAFNGFPGAINLEDYITKGVEPPKINGGTFSHIGVLDLNEVDENDEKWLNIGIREEGNTEERIQAFENKFELQGFKIKDPPPLLGTNGFPRDGRGRIIAAKRRGERYIPVFYYVITDDSYRSKVTDGLSENLRHDPAFGAGMESVITGCITLISKNELTHSEVAVRDYLHHELKIQLHFAPHNITKIVAQVMARATPDGAPLVLIQDPKVWKKWAEKAGVTIDGKKVVLLCCDNETYPWRAWCQHILPAIVENDEPIEVIPYSKKHVPSTARKNIKGMRDTLDSLCETSYLMVSKDYAPAAFPMKTKPFICYRTVPALIGKHDVAFKSHRFIEIDKF